MANEPQIGKSFSVKVGKQAIAAVPVEPEVLEYWIGTQYQVADGPLRAECCDCFCYRTASGSEEGIVPCIQGPKNVENLQQVLERSEILGISPNNKPREVFDDATDVDEVEVKELEKLAAALSAVDSAEPARRNDGRYSSDMIGRKRKLELNYDSRMRKGVRNVKVLLQIDRR